MLGAPYEGVPVVRTGAARWRRVVMPLVVLSAVGLVALLLAGRGQQTEIQGAGSTLAQPLIERAASDFRNAQAADDPTRPEETGNDWVLNGSGIEYEPVGSMGGIMRLSDPEIDFAVSDYPLSADGLKELAVAQFPIALGAIAVVHSVDLPAGQDLRLDADTLAAIYSGEITRWNDPRIAATNRGVRLPDQAMSVVHRSDGSGSTRGFTGYLSAGSPQWAAGPGTGTEIEWPTGAGAERTEGVIEQVRGNPGSIGYVEFGQAGRAGLDVAALANASGMYVLPSEDAMLAAASSHNWSGSDDYVTALATADDKQAYPATVAIYVMVKRDPEFARQTQRTLNYLRFLLQDFGGAAKDLGYVPLPASAAQAIENYWNRTVSGAT
ncbi:phosphate ABC transporter substrate-binding protein PstS [Mycobacterium deserti]|uniref:Phosphate-binding protein n=1 Tax=Mycobacterium deserti TaxID=2978347 RepID=A0ABT2M8Z5_9MYCO|nr:phosphate ABC transporter substrate-binding protein PstS [Mycobacterium deserti]MCT7658729.1 phosphate ABC transporter substrate-binding protein PstS [Mycobacterium deserti]